MSNRIKDAYRSTQEYRATKVAHEQATINNGQHISNLANLLTLTNGILDIHQLSLDRFSDGFQNNADHNLNYAGLSYHSLSQIHEHGH